MLQKFFLPERRNNASVNSYFPKPTVILLGAVHKGRPHKIAKIDLLPPCPCGHTINFQKSEVFFTKKCGRPHLSSPLSENVRTRQTPSPLTADIFYGQPLSYDVIFTLIFVSLVQHTRSFGPRAATASASPSLGRGLVAPPSQCESTSWFKN